MTFFLSLLLHAGVLLLLILGFDHVSKLAVFENTDKQDVISAVILGDTPKSKIVPKPAAPVPAPVPKAAPIPLPKPNIIFGKDLLSDIKKQKEKKNKQVQQEKQEQQKKLQAQFEKTLRQQLLNEEIKLQGKESRQSQGEVNKYKALILQAISEQWIVPSQANKHLFCELMVRTEKGGKVLDVQIVKTSGDPSLDSSARAAVLKASPLPVPQDLDAFGPFKQFILKVRPENITDL